MAMRTHAGASVDWANLPSHSLAVSTLTLNVRSIRRLPLVDGVKQADADRVGTIESPSRGFTIDNFEFFWRQ